MIRWLVLFSIVLAVHARVSAQDKPTAEAKVWFDRGVEAMQAGHLADARAHYERSLSLVPTTSTYYNLAVVLRGLGQPTRAVAVLGDLEARFGKKLSRAERSEVEELLASVRTERASVTVSAPCEKDRLLVNGTEQMLNRMDPTLYLDPGQYELVVERQGAEIFRARPRLTKGQRFTVATGGCGVTVEQSITPTKVSTEDEGGAEWVWWTLGAGVLVAAAVTTVVLVASSGGQDPGTALPENNIATVRP